MTVAIVLGLLLLGGVLVSLYMKDSQTVPQAKDSQTVPQAKIVRAYIVNFCMEHARYLSKEEFDKRFPNLAHAVRDPNGRAYNRTAHLLERRKMMQDWADYLDKIKNSAKVIPIHHNA